MIDIKKQIENLAGAYSRHLGNACDNLAQYHDGNLPTEDSQEWQDFLEAVAEAISLNSWVNKLILPDEIYNNHFEEVMNLAMKTSDGWYRDVLQNA
jgi:hypothetical protein